MRRWVLLGVLLLILLTVAWWVFLISPRNGRIAEERDNLAAAQDHEVTLRTRVARLQEVEEARPQYETAILTMDALIPEQPLLDQFFDEFSALAEATGVQVDEVAPAVPAVGTDSVLREIEIQATVRGEFFEMLGFLFGLDDMERLARVDSISVVSTPNEEGVTELSTRLSLRLFTLSDLLPTAPAPDGGSTTTVPGESTTSTIEEN